MPRFSHYNVLSLAFWILFAASTGAFASGGFDTSLSSSELLLQQAPKHVAASYSCEPRRTCSQIRSCDEAQWYLANCGWGPRLDGDADGSPCETLCGSNN